MSSIADDLLRDLAALIDHAQREKTPTARLAVLRNVARELKRLRRENTALRVLASRVQCPYDQRLPDGSCGLGYPGCHCENDIAHLLEARTGDYGDG